MSNYRRKAGSYEIVVAVSIGHKEIVLGMDETKKDGQKYMCAYCEANEMFEEYKDVLVSDNYPEIVKIFGERTSIEAEKICSQISKLKIPIEVIKEDDCIPDSYKNDINGKLIAISSDALRPEFRRAERQLYVVTGGFGASANSRGSAVFCRNVYDGKHARFERMDVLGEVKKERIPEWAKEKINSFNNTKETVDYVR